VAAARSGGGSHRPRSMQDGADLVAASLAGKAGPGRSCGGGGRRGWRPGVDDAADAGCSALGEFSLIQLLGRAE
jgi:hypothetical protein